MITRLTQTLAAMALLVLAACNTTGTTSDTTNTAGNSPTIADVYLTPGCGNIALADKECTGYDAVAFFSLNAVDGPVAGDPQYSHEHKGAVWHFANAANRDAFAANPAKYAPKYGGHCAMAMAHGKESRGSPHAWAVHNGKLYVQGGKGALNRWNDNRDVYISRADGHWKDTFGQH